MESSKSVTAVEWLAEKYNEVNWLRNRDEISSKYADELREVFLYQAKEMEKEQMFDIMQQFASFCVKCDREKLPLLFAKEWFKQFEKK